MPKQEPRLASDRIFNLKLEKLVVAMLMFSLALLSFFLLVPRTITITPTQDPWFSDTGDDSHEGGTSTVENLSNEDGFAFRYQLKPSAGYPHVTFMIAPNVPQEHKLAPEAEWRNQPFVKHKLSNLSWVDTISFDARVSGKPSENFRLYVRAHDDAMYDPDDFTSRRYAEAVFTLTEEKKKVVLSRDMFHVPAWWIDKHKIDASEANKPQFDKFVWLEFASSTLDVNELVTVNFDSIELSGRWIPPSIFYPSLLSLWLAMATGVLISWIYRTTRKLNLLHAKAREFQDRANQDFLTGLLNRRGVSECMHLFQSFAKNKNSKLGLILFDIDHFKQLNDDHGHAHGDNVLKQVSGIVLDFTSKNDMSGIRWGGEEFLLIAPGHDEQQLANLSEELRQLFESETEITCSFGVRELSREDSFEDAIRKADRALYYSKYLGRNRTSIFSEKDDLPDSQFASYISGNTKKPLE